MRHTIMAKKANIENGEMNRANRLIIPLTADDQIDWESVRPDQRKQIMSTVMDDVPILEHIGMAHVDTGNGDNTDIDGESAEGQVTIENVKAGLDILTRTNALLFRLVAPRIFADPILSQRQQRRVPLAIDMDIAIGSFGLTEKQHAELDPRALRLAKKYIPEAAKKNLDVILLCTQLLKYQAESVQVALKAQSERNMERAKRMTPIGQAPVPDTDKKVIPPNGHAPEPSVMNPNAQPGATDDTGGESLDPGAEPVV